jgi:hypothetical protein
MKNGSHSRLHVHAIGMALALAAFLFTTGLTAQEKKIKIKELPRAVSSAFKKEYPKAKITSASTEVEKGTTYYEIESTDGKTKRNLLLTADGTITEIEESIPMSALPPEVSGSFEKEFPNVKLDRAEKVTEGQAVTFEFHFNLGKVKKEVVIDPSGKILKGKTKAEDKGEKEDDDDDEDED